MRIAFLRSESRSLCLDITLCSLREWNVGAIWLHLIIHLCVCKWFMCIWKCHWCTWVKLISHSLSYRTCTRFRTYQQKIVVNEYTSYIVQYVQYVHYISYMYKVQNLSTRYQRIYIVQFVEFVQYVHCISYLYKVQNL